MSAFSDLWDELATKGSTPAYQLIDPGHPLALYGGIDETGAQIFLTLSEREPPEPDQTFGAFDVTKYHRTDGRWALTIRLTQPELKKLFGHLCDDLVIASRNLKASDNSGRFFLERITRWEELLSKATNSLLDNARLRGLVAELLFFEQFGIPSRGAKKTIQAWQGPLAAAQDFRFHDRAIEVKVFPPRSGRVRISSADQLDWKSQALFLTVFGLQEAVAQTPGAFTLNDLVERVRQRIDTEGGDKNDFDARLKCAGYVYHAEYDKTHLLVESVTHFQVADGFPAIRKSALPDAIGFVRYHLDLTLCSAFTTATCF